MLRFRKNDRYTSIAIYAFIVLALIMLAVVVCINLPYFFGILRNFFTVMNPLLIGLAIAYICNPLLRRIERAFSRRLGRRYAKLCRILSLFVTYLTLLLIIALILLMMIPQIANNYQDFYKNINMYISLLVERIDAWLAESSLFGGGHSLSELLSSKQFSEALQSFMNSVTSALGAFSVQFLAIVGNVLLGVFLSFYVLLFKEYLLAAIRKIFLAVFPMRAYRAVRETLQFTDRAFGQFIIGKLFDSLIVWAIAFVVFAIARIPYYPMIATIVGVASIIPAFGPVLGMIPGFLIIFVKDPIMALVFLALAVLIQQVDGNIIGPKIVGSSTGLSAVWVITAIILIGAWIGPIGWFIGVPLFSVIYRLVGDFANRRLAKKSYPTDLALYETTTLPDVIGTYPPAAQAREDTSQEKEETTHEEVDE